MTDLLNPFPATPASFLAETGPAYRAPVTPIETVNAFSPAAFTGSDTAYRYEEWFQTMLRRESEAADQDKRENGFLPAANAAAVLGGNQETSWAPPNTTTATGTPSSPSMLFSLRLSGLDSNANFTLTYFDGVKTASEKWKADEAGNLIIVLSIAQRKYFNFSIDTTAFGSRVHLSLQAQLTGSPTTRIQPLGGFAQDGETPYLAPVGSWTAKNEVHFASKAEKALTEKAISWSAKISHLKDLLTKTLNGDKASVEALDDHYYNLSYGKGLLPTLGKVVQNGSSYTASTFWGALDRLHWANNFEYFVVNAFKEAQSPVNPLYDKRFTISTAAMVGFFALHPAVRGHSPLAIAEPNKTALLDYSFSTFVRSELVRLNYTVNGTNDSNANKYGSVVKGALKKAADTADLGFLIDGHGDPWDPTKKTVRGRELQVIPDDTPELPFVDPDVVEQQGTIVGQEIQQFRTFGIAARIATATEVEIAYNGIGAAVHDGDAIAQRARGGADNFAAQLTHFFTIPGVALRVTLTNGQTADRAWLNLFFRAHVINFQDDVEDYAAHPTFDDEYNALRFYFEDEGWIASALDADPNVESFDLLTPSNAMRIINTLLIGNNVRQGVHIVEDPWQQFATEEVDELAIFRRRVEQLRRLQHAPIGNVYTNDNLLYLIMNTAANCG